MELFMKPMTRIVNTCTFLAIFMSLSVYAESTHREEENTGIEALSPALRTLLTKEMLAIQTGMMSLIPAYAAGNWSEIEAIAHNIKNSYILKQSLTDEQVHELHSSLPALFIEQDQQFHYFSGMLEHAASMHKPELVGFYFAKMNEACISCHSQFATHRFPALSPQKDSGEHTH